MSELAEMINETLHSKKKNKSYSYRHGKRYLLHHRFEVKNGVSNLDMLADNVTRNNALMALRKTITYSRPSVTCQSNGDPRHEDRCSCD